MRWLQSYMSCIQNMKEIGLDEAVPSHVPTHGIGHSNGALMHLLIGSLVQAPYTSNVLMSFNNKEVADAIPIPGAPPAMMRAMKCTECLRRRTFATVHTCRCDQDLWAM